MAEVARWYLALALIGGGGVLPAALLFGPLRSGGVLYARPLALLLVAEAAWLASALGHARYGLPLVLVAVAALWGWSAALAWRRPALWRAVRARGRLLAAGEAVCLLLFAAIALARAQAPNARATEKPMDLMLLATVRAAETLPPPDAWFAGAPLAYYHLGPVMVDVVARVAGQPPAIAFTLGVATAGALAGAAAFALGGDVVALSPLRRRATPWLAGALAVTLLLLAAPLEGLLELVAAQGIGRESWWQALGVEGFPGPAFIERGVPTQFWWWWRASRVLPGVITEFPAFSIVLGDVHAHLLALPLAVLAVAAVLPTFAPRGALTLQGWLQRPGALAVAAALFAGLAMTNTWDAAIYGALWAAAAAAAFMSVGWPLPGTLFPALRYLALPVGGALLIAWPLLATLRGAPGGVAAVTGRASDPARLLLFWLPLALPVVAGAWLLRVRAPRASVAAGAAVGCAAVLAWAAFAASGGHGEALRAREAGWGTLALLVAAGGGAGAAAASALRARDPGRAAWLALAAAAAAVVLATELVFLVDAFADRMNTVFKFWYAAWLLLATAGAAALAMVYDRGALLRPRALTLPALAVALALTAGSLLYAPAAAVARGRESQPRTLDALAYLDDLDPGAAAALRWLRAHRGELGAHAVLLEAVGADYGEGNVIAAASGLPTLLGWPGHQLQWRGARAPIGEHQATVRRIYATAQREEVPRIAREAGVTHVYLGREEAAQYGPALAERFAGWPVVFAAEGARIVAVPAAPAGGTGR